MPEENQKTADVLALKSLEGKVFRGTGEGYNTRIKERHAFYFAKTEEGIRSYDLTIGFPFHIYWSEVPSLVPIDRRDLTKEESHYLANLEAEQSSPSRTKARSGSQKGIPLFDPKGGSSGDYDPFE